MTIVYIYICYNMCVFTCFLRSFSKNLFQGVFTKFKSLGDVGSFKDGTILVSLTVSLDPGEGTIETID